MDFTEIFKPNDNIKVIFKKSRKSKEHEKSGKVTAVNKRFLTVNWGKYTESLEIYKVHQGQIEIIKTDCG